MNAGMPRLRQTADSLDSFFAGRSNIDELKVPPKRPVGPLFSASQPQHPLQKALQPLQIFQRLLHSGTIFFRIARPVQ